MSFLAYIFLIGQKFGKNPKPSLEKNKSVYDHVTPFNAARLTNILYMGLKMDVVMRSWFSLLLGLVG
jgi:dolichol kinase